jgi:hypothetical protein
MFFLTNLYERRFNENMSRHRLDAKIAPSKPKPACRLVQNNDVPHKTEPFSRYHLANEVKTEVPMIGQQAPSSPPTYHNQLLAQNSNTVSESSLFEAQKAPVVIGANPFKRSNSQESGFFTGGDSDVASNFSVSA